MYFEVIFTYSTISNFNIIQVKVHFFYQNVPQKVAECPKKSRPNVRKTPNQITVSTSLLADSGRLRSKSDVYYGDAARC